MQIHKNTSALFITLGLFQVTCFCKTKVKRIYRKEELSNLNLFPFISQCQCKDHKGEGKA